MHAGVSWGHGGICLPVHGSSSCSCRRLFFCLGDKVGGAPFKCRESSYGPARQLPSKICCQEAPSGGRKSPNKPVLQARGSHCSSTGSIAREGGGGGLKELDPEIKERAHLYPQSPAQPSRTSQGKGFLQPESSPERKGKRRPEDLKKMAFFPSGTVFCCCSCCYTWTLETI